MSGVLPTIQNVLDNINVGICILDSSGSFLFVNKAILDFNGRTRKDFMGKTVQDLFREGIIDKCIFETVYKTKRPVTQIQTSVSVNGEPRERLAEVSPIFDSEGNVVYAVSVQRSLQKLNQEYVKAKKLSNTKTINYSKVIDKYEIIANSSAMKTVLENSAIVANTDSTVLLYGESGTGKEVVAKFIHLTSLRRHRDMVEINCASLPESLLEAELFGYEKGAFTGALSSGKTGLIEAAGQSTLFLDEINSMPLSVQAKLLRVLETKTITKIASVKPKPVDFRLIAATNADLSQCVQNGTFRADLYYRLNVIPITIPPLRERKEDIVPLAKHFLEHFCEKYGIAKKFSNKVYQTMEQHDWPGNVREVKNFVERMVIMSISSCIKINQIPNGMLEMHTPQKLCEINTNKLPPEDEKEKILRALSMHSGHREKTARYLGISRRTLQYKLAIYGIK